MPLVPRAGQSRLYCFPPRRGGYIYPVMDTFMARHPPGDSTGHQRAAIVATSAWRPAGCGCGSRSVRRYLSYPPWLSMRHQALEHGSTIDCLGQRINSLRLPSVPFPHAASIFEPISTTRKTAEFRVRMGSLTATRKGAIGGSAIHPATTRMIIAKAGFIWIRSVRHETRRCFYVRARPQNMPATTGTKSSHSVASTQPGPAPRMRGVPATAGQ